MIPHGPVHPPMERHALRAHLQSAHSMTLGLTGYRWSLEELRLVHRHEHGQRQAAWVGRAVAKDMTGSAA